MLSWRILSEIGESLISRNQPAILILNERPQKIVRRSLPTLSKDGRRVMSARDQQVGNLPGQILVDLNPHSLTTATELNEVGGIYRFCCEF